MNNRLDSRRKERLGEEIWPNFVTNLSVTPARRDHGLDARDDLGVALGQREDEDLVQVFAKLGPVGARRREARTRTSATLGSPDRPSSQDLDPVGDLIRLGGIGQISGPFEGESQTLKFS